MRALMMLVVLVVSRAQAESALQVSCADCGAFQGIQVLVDGVDRGTNSSVFIEGVDAGRHEVKVVKWVSPFKTELLFEGLVDVPEGMVLRAKATKGKFDVYGRSAWAAPVRGPSAEQLADARAWLEQASDSLEELKGRVEDSDEPCVGKVSARLGALDDALDEAKARPSRATVDLALGKAGEAQQVLGAKCGTRTAAKWGKPLGRVVTALQSASRTL